MRIEYVLSGKALRVSANASARVMCECECECVCEVECMCECSKMGLRERSCERV